MGDRSFEGFARSLIGDEMRLAASSYCKCLEQAPSRSLKPIDPPLFGCNSHVADARGS